MAKKKNSWSFFVPLIILIVIIGLIAVFYHKPAPTPTTKEPIKIGAILPLSGNLAFLGESFREGMELAVKESRGLIRINYQDCSSNPSQAVEAANFLTNIEKTKIIISIITFLSRSVAPQLSEKNVLHFAVVYDPKITKEYNKSCRFFVSSISTYKKIKEFIERNTSIKKVAVIYFNSAEHNYVIEEKLVPYLETKHIEYLLEKYEIGQKDFMTDLLKIKEFNPDLLLIISFANNYPNIFDHINVLGLKESIPNIFVDLNILDAVANPEIDLNKLNGVKYIAWKEFVCKEKAQREFERKFIEEYGHSPSYLSYFGYDHIKIIEKMIKSGKKTPTEIYESLRNSSFSGVVGVGKFNEFCDIDLNYVIGKIRNGKLVCPD